MAIFNSDNTGIASRLYPTWDEGFKICEEIGLTLAVITTHEEQEQAYAAAKASLTGQFHNALGVNFHIGIRRKDGI